MEKKEVKLVGKNYDVTNQAHKKKEKKKDFPPLHVLYHYSKVIGSCIDMLIYVI